MLSIKKTQTDRLPPIVSTLHNESVQLQASIATTGQDDKFPKFSKKYKLFNEALTGLISDYSLVNFVPVTVKSKERLLAASQVIDKANGYVFGSGEERSLRNLMGSALGGADFEWSKTVDIRTEYMEQEEEPFCDKKEKFGNDSIRSIL